MLEWAAQRRKGSVLREVSGEGLPVEGRIQMDLGVGRGGDSENHGENTRRQLAGWRGNTAHTGHFHMLRSGPSSDRTQLSPWRKQE